MQSRFRDRNRYPVRIRGFLHKAGISSARRRPLARASESAATISVESALSRQAKGEVVSMEVDCDEALLVWDFQLDR